MKKLIVLFLLFLVSITASAHQDFWVVKEFGNVTTRVKTGYRYEEIKKVQIIGKLAELLAKSLNYVEPILLDFNHTYTKSTEPTYFISFDDGSIKYSFDKFLKSKPLLDKKGIVVRQVSSEFNVVNTLKMLEHSIINWKRIQREQKEIEYNENYCEWIINSISQRKIRKVLKKRDSEIITQTINTKIYRPEEDIDYGLTYYWKNNKYHLIFLNGKKETHIRSLSNMYDIQRVSTAAFIFEEPSDFIVFDNWKKEITSKKWKIENAEKNYRPYQIKHISTDKFSIILNYYSKELKTREKNQILIYALDNDKLIQDLDEILNVHCN